MAKKKRGRRPALANYPTEALQKELERRASQIDELVAQRDELAAQLAELDAKIAEVGGAVVSPARRVPGRRPGRRGRSGRRPGRGAPGMKRPKNDMSLAEAMAKLLKNKTLSVTEITSEVQKAGYKTHAANFRTIVNQTLIKDPRFKKVARGQYTAANG
ncbi:MAG: hypothetical protein Kow0022_12440 [Phycisphaerales bacterium]